MDRAAWHTTGKIKCFDNIIPMPLPPYWNQKQDKTFKRVADTTNTSHQKVTHTKLLQENKHFLKKSLN
jgi:hypothetical protein